MRTKTAVDTTVDPAEHGFARKSAAGRDRFDSFRLPPIELPKETSPVSDEFYEDEDELAEEIQEEEYEYEEDEYEDDEATLETDDDYEVEEISSDEVDSVVANLNSLNDAIDSENIRSIIENAVDKILRLVYTDDELVTEDEDEEEGDDYLEEAA